ncbi:MAG: prepilin-type N-terminal cleavage/methylation domain-containing protein [Gemmatimonadetes bacterium]|nr:prepilin-type N-terminal cleavage/methylation domain-containing protein [Gemmatimonadota bacterium]
MQRHRNAGFTLLEMLMVMLIVAVMTSVAGAQYRDYIDRVGPERAARLIGTYVLLTRSYAIQRRAPVSLVLDTTEHKMWIRSATDTIRSLELGPDSDFRIETLTMGFPGDSISFSSRGVCRECGLTGTGTITVAGEHVGYVVTFNALGVWKMAKQ